MGKIKVDGKDIGKETDKREWERTTRQKREREKSKTKMIKRKDDRRDWDRQTQINVVGESERGTQTKEWEREKYWKREMQTKDGQSRQQSSVCFRIRFIRIRAFS